MLRYILLTKNITILTILFHRTEVSILQESVKFTYESLQHLLYWKRTQKIKKRANKNYLSNLITSNYVKMISRLYDRENQTQHSALTDIYWGCVKTIKHSSPSTIATIKKSKTTKRRLYSVKIMSIYSF